jgi:glyoxalase family protein
MRVQPSGIHHITAVATDPQRNVDFYEVVLGLRLVKQTVNFDMPDTYHLYYGDGQGAPGTILTFFPWPGTPSGRRGTGQATVVSFSVPEGSLGWWRDQLRSKGVAVGPPVTRLEEEAISLEDPDGLLLELVAHERAPAEPPWEGSPIPGDHAVRGFRGITLTEAMLDPTAEMFGERLGFRLADESSGRLRFEAGAGAADGQSAEPLGTRVDVVCQPEAPRGLVAGGTVHHVAWRAPDEAVQKDWRDQLLGAGVDVTPVIDRQYFRSIYFREPGGVLLEIATDPPGFTVDEPLLELGRRLRLPPWLEPSRQQIEAALPPLARATEPRR